MVSLCPWQLWIMDRRTKTISVISFLAGMLFLAGIVFLIKWQEASELQTIMATADYGHTVTFEGRSCNVADEVSRARLSGMLEQRIKPMYQERNFIIRLETGESVPTSAVMHFFNAVTVCGVSTMEAVDRASQKSARFYAVGDEQLFPFKGRRFTQSIGEVWTNPETKNSFVSIQLAVDGVITGSGKFPYPIPGKVLEAIRSHYVTLYVAEAVEASVLIDCVATLQSLSAHAVFVIWSDDAR